MPNTSETGHAKNVANFESLIAFCAGYGTTYNPSKNELKVAGLQALLTAARNTLKECKTSETAFDNATDARKFVFKDLQALSTRIVSALSVSGVPDNVIEGARTIIHKIQGQRAGARVKSAALPTSTDDSILTATIPVPKTISSSQTSFDSQVEHFNGLIELVSTHTEYDPNETELQVATLQIKLTEMQSATTNCKTAYTAWSNSRVNRDILFYEVNKGLVDIAIDVKGYIKSLYGASSPQYLQVSGIGFRNLRD